VDELQSTCPITGLKIIGKPEWNVAVPEKNYRAAISILGNQILKAEIHGYSTRQESRKTAHVFDQIIPEYLNTAGGFVQIFDMKESTGFSLASRKNYQRVIQRRKGVLGHIFYNTSLMFNISMRLGRKLNQVGFGAHIVNNYDEAVNLAVKLINTHIPASSQLQVDTTLKPFTAFETDEYCPVSGLPIYTRPEWTQVDFGNGYSATFKIIGNSILWADPCGRAGFDEFKSFFKMRANVIQEAFGTDKPFFEIKDYGTTRTPPKNMRHLFIEQMLVDKNRIIGFIAFNAPVGVKFSLNVGKRLVRPICPVQVVPNYEKAIRMAISAMDYHHHTGQIPPYNFFSSWKDLVTYKSPHFSVQIEHYVDELLHFLGNINWEIDGLDSTMGKIPSAHPFSHVFEAIALIKYDLDNLSRERRNAVKALLKSEKLYRLLAENAMDVIWTSSLDRKPIYYSPSACPMTGYSMDELMNCPVGTHMTHESGILLLQTLDALMKNNGTKMEAYNPFILLELEHIHKSGTHYWAEVKVSFIRDTEGNYVGLVGVTRDISERKKAEGKAITSWEALQKTQEQLIQSEKMAALGSLVAGVSHEISTPLGISVTASSFLQQKTAEFELKKKEGRLTIKDLDTYINLALESTAMISNNLNRASELINSFKQISVDQSNEMKRHFNLKSYTQSILHSLNPRFKRTAFRIQLDCPDHITVESFPGALSQILTNLVMNSLIHGFDAQDKGDINVKMWATHQILFIEYRDDGKGMDEKTLKHVYDPFYTTKRASGGTGLGMHIVYNIVTGKLNGQITCESKPGQGTTFLIQLPH